MTISGIFGSSTGADSAVQALKGQGFTEHEVSLIVRGDQHSAGARGLGAAMGSVLGMGAATFLVPGLGPVAGVGMIAAALAGAGLGAAAGKVADKMTAGIPNDELYFYEEAVRDGQIVLFVDAKNPDRATQARNILEQSGARNVHTVRRDFWQNLRESERDYARSRGLEFEPNEADYQAGFEAALHPATRGRSLAESMGYIESCYPGPCRTEAFLIGFDRGQAYLLQRTSAREME